MMMVEGDEGSSLIMDELFSVEEGVEEDLNEVFLDLDTFWQAMGGPPDIPEGNRLDGSPLVDGVKGVQTSKALPSTKGELQEFGVLYPPHTSEALYWSRCTDGFPESAGSSSILDGERLEPATRIGEGNDLLNTQADGDSQNASSSCRNDKIYTENFVEESNFRNPLSQKQDSSAINGEKAYLDSSYHESNASETSGTDILSENGDLYFWNSEDQPYVPYSSAEVKSFAYDDGVMDEKKNPFRPLEDLVRIEVGQGTAKYENGGTFSFGNGVGITESSGMPTMRSESKNPSPNIFSNDNVKVKNNVEPVTSNDIVSRASEAIGNVIGRKCFGPLGELSTTEVVEWPLSNSLSLFSCDNFVSHPKDEKEDKFFESRTVPPFGMTGETSMQNSAPVAHDWRHVLKYPEHPGILPPHSIKAEVNYQKLEHEVPKYNDCNLSKVTSQGVHSNTLIQNDIDDDSDLCILEDMSAPARPNRMAVNSQSVAAPQFTSRDTGNQIVTSHTRIKPNDERVIFRVALQDLSQPKSESTPPDGVLSVPLLKHQRIALSWMVNKETQSACCSGGILADDQGLGKTISTIALILKERSPSSKSPKVHAIQSAEMLNLDEDDDGVLETSHTMEGAEPLQVNGCTVNGGKTSLQAKGRPSGGTLIVCPTSVLRQWSEELHNKVTKEADLSVLVYYGSNRTKDPVELAKYDVVVTTYAIVSMEVPKQPVVNENDDPIGSPFKEFSSCKKRKLHEPMSDKKSSLNKKSKKGIDSDLLDDTSGPLAKVGWFRIVLDEAQSIKNHRTQVARACWGLRAKRRWCLSGTPIQNAIDDLYSYFRFLRHEPYAVFRTFCEQLKVPIHKNPKNGYKKLQLVLKTIMLRRTKGTLLDGEPIINLPPKTIELKKIDFSMEEREFYCRLEADSQAQFAEYAAAGTVKQNYVNILLMLLRLRQACDHPLLVKGFSNSKLSSSIEMAKELSREKQISLLNCLEASLAICGICSDPPEDAVVTVCGHVFCNQCISEHVIGDDTQCPTKKCKRHISMSCVFSIPTLRNALSDQPTMENTTKCSGSEVAEVSESRSLRCPQDSSKIKAALDILLSLSKPKDFATRTNCLELIEGCCGSDKMHFCDSGKDTKTSETSSDVNGDSNNLIQAVGEKAIVFSQWTGMLDLLEDCLKNTPIQYRRLDGTMPVAARDRAVKDFNNLPQVSVMIMSLKAASLGLNMVAACNVILLDLWWNPTTEDQAIDRAHRIGQRRPVSVYRLTVNDTVEDRILALQQRKRKMVASAFGEDETGSRQTRLTVDDLKYLFRV